MCGEFTHVQDIETPPVSSVAPRYSLFLKNRMLIVLVFFSSVTVVVFFYCRIMHVYDKK